MKCPHCGELIPTEFGAKLKTFREKYNLTQQEMAGIMGITQSNYSRYEGGKMMLGIEGANKIIKLLEAIIQKLEITKTLEAGHAQ